MFLFSVFKSICISSFGYHVHAVLIVYCLKLLLVQRHDRRSHMGLIVAVTLCLLYHLDI